MPTFHLNYHNLAERLECASWKLETNWFPELATHLSEYEEALRTEEEMLHTTLDCAVLQWISSDEFPIISPRETFFLKLRFVGAFHLLYQLQLEDGSSVFRVDGMREKSFLVWLLTSWARDAGFFEGFEVLISWNKSGLKKKQ